MNSRLILVTFWILLGSQFSLGQNPHVIGRILDYETNEPIEAITILEKYPINGAVTDSTGNFEFKIEGKTKKLEISFIGYYGIEFINIPIDKKTIDFGDIRLVRNYSLYIHVEMAPDIKPDKRKDKLLKKDVIDNYSLNILDTTLFPVFKDREIIFDFNKN